MTASFLLLEIVDPEVSAFLWALRSIVSGRKARGPIHVTLRGPYEGEPPKQTFDLWCKALAHDVLRISGVGRFSNSGEEVVFLKVNSPNLRTVWWKPSFPIQQFGFAPHISVYKGTDVELATLVSRFLSHEKLTLLCAEHRLIWHRSGQANLFVSQVPTVGAMDHLYDTGRIDVTVLDRLQDSIDHYRAGDKPQRRLAGQRAR